MKGLFADQAHTAIRRCWTAASLTVADSQRLCTQAVNEFQSLVSQVQKSSSMVEKVVYNIVNANLVKDPGSTGRQDVVDLQELYDHLERHRLEVSHLCSW